MNTVLRRSGLRPGLVLIPVVAAVLCLALVYGAGALVFSRDVGPLRAAIALAFQTGDLPDHRVSEPDRHTGAFTYNDCLILMMAVNTSQPLLQKVISPAPIEKRSDPSETDACLMLHEFVVDGRATDFDSWPYHRYVSAFVAPSAIAVPAFGLAAWREILLAVNYAAVAALGALGALGWARERQAGRPARPADIGAMILSLVFVSFFGMEFYSQNLSIGLAEPVVFAWLGALAFGRPLDWTPARLVAVTAAAFAAITALEFWTGQIPLAAAAGVGFIGLAIRDARDVRRAVGCAVLMLLAAGGTIAATMALKIVAASVVFQENVLANVTGQLEVRVGDTGYGVGNLLLHLGGRADHIGQGSLVLGLLAGLGAVIAGTAGLVRLAASPDKAARGRALFVVASALMIAAWHLVFRNHSSIHSEFMVRTFAWVWTAGFVLLALSRQVGAEARVPPAASGLTPVTDP